VQGTGSAGGQTLTASVEGAGAVVRSASAFIDPELGLDVKLGSFHLGVSVALFLFLADGPSLPNGALTVPRNAMCSATNAGQIGCGQQSDAVKGESAYGRSLFVSPQLAAGYAF
jgi:hypothetical protein